MPLAIDALYYPTLGVDIVTLEGVLFQFLFSSLFVALTAFPTLKYGSYLIDNLNINTIWYITIVFSGIILAINMYITPIKYETLYVNNVFSAFVFSVLMTLLILIILVVMFYHIVKGILYTSDISRTKRTSPHQLPMSLYLDGLAPLWSLARSALADILLSCECSSTRSIFLHTTDYSIA